MLDIFRQVLKHRSWKNWKDEWMDKQTYDQVQLFTGWMDTDGWMKMDRSTEEWMENKDERKNGWQKMNE